MCVSRWPFFTILHRTVVVKACWKSSNCTHEAEVVEGAGAAKARDVGCDVEAVGRQVHAVQVRRVHQLLPAVACVARVGACVQGRVRKAGRGINSILANLCSCHKTPGNFSLHTSFLITPGSPAVPGAPPTRELLAVWLQPLHDLPARIRHRTPVHVGGRRGCGGRCVGHLHVVKKW